MSNNTKKLLILNLPYFIAGLVCTNLGEAWRIAEGADMSEKLLSLIHISIANFSSLLRIVYLPAILPPPCL